MGGEELLVEAHAESFDPAEEEERVKGGEGAAGGIDGEGEAGCKLGGVGVDYPGHEVVVPREVFCGRFVYDVGAEEEWVTQVR